ncbi:small ribosomal subunit protein bS21m [Aulostomus maculatus]
MASHLRFVSRTVMVHDGKVEMAFKKLNGILTREKIFETAMRKRYYEKPCRQRQRKNFEMCKRIYNTELSRKIFFLSRVNREDPWLGS